MTPNEVVQHACHEALDFFGEKAQVIQTIEELSELGVELAKIANDRTLPHKMAGHRSRLVDEVADVSFMLQQVILTFHITEEEIETVILKKAKNLSDRIARMRFIQKNGVEA